MVNSMTGFAALKGAEGGTRWAWEVRSVNARGLDLRLRLPEGLPDLEQHLRKLFTGALARGNVTLNLRLQADTALRAAALDSDQLDHVLGALKTVEARAEEQGLHLTASSAADILSLKGVIDSAESAEENRAALVPRLKEEAKTLLAAFLQARADEGRALAGIIEGQIGRIGELVAAARALEAERRTQMEDTLRRNLAMVLDNSEGVDESRLAQELALIAVKADVSEEIDRLEAHVAAARALLGDTGPVGRKFDFLTQEFNREANTLCSKSGLEALTRIGLDLKTVIDQMREQVQNVE